MLSEPSPDEPFSSSKESLLLQQQSPHFFNVNHMITQLLEHGYHLSAAVLLLEDEKKQLLLTPDDIDNIDEPSTHVYSSNHSSMNEKNSKAETNINDNNNNNIDVLEETNNYPTIDVVVGTSEESSSCCSPENAADNNNFHDDHHHHHHITTNTTSSSSMMKSPSRKNTNTNVMTGRSRSVSTPPRHSPYAMMMMGAVSPSSSSSHSSSNVMSATSPELGLRDTVVYSNSMLALNQFNQGSSNHHHHHHHHAHHNNINNGSGGSRGMITTHKFEPHIWKRGLCRHCFQEKHLHLKEKTRRTSSVNQEISLDDPHFAQQAHPHEKSHFWASLSPRDRWNVAVNSNHQQRGISPRWLRGDSPPVSPTIGASNSKEASPRNASLVHSSSPTTLSPSSSSPRFTTTKSHSPSSSSPTSSSSSSSINNEMTDCPYEDNIWKKNTCRICHKSIELHLSKQQKQ